MDAAVVVDASVWVSLLMPQDVHHAASRLWLEDYISRGGLFTAPTFLLVEAAAALARRSQQAFPARQAVQYLTSLSLLHLVPVDTVLINDAIDAAINFRLRGGDAMYVGLAQQLGIPLISWDHEQLRRAGVSVVTYSPDGYPF
jgi:predicted nucleic acid-binding protein